MFEKIKEKIKMAFTPYFVLFYVFVVIAWHFKDIIFNFIKMAFN